MKCTEVKLRDVGHFGECTFNPHEGLNVITGANGTGKTLLTSVVYNLIRGAAFNDAGQLTSIAGYFHKSGNSKIQVDYLSSEGGFSLVYPDETPAGAFGVYPITARGFVTRLRGSLIDFSQRGPLSSIVHISSERGRLIQSAQEVVHGATWRSAQTMERFSRLRHLLDLIHDLDDGSDQKIDQTLARFFPGMTKLIKVRNAPSTNLRQADIVSFGKKHEVISSASGCLEILFIVAETALVSEGVIIIDEPEGHLHPLAQDMMAKYLEYLASPEGGNNQVIVSTHSLPIIYGGKSGKVFNLRREDDSIHLDSIIELGIPTIAYESALPELGYSRTAMESWRELYRDFCKKNNREENPGGWGWDS